MFSKAELIADALDIALGIGLDAYQSNNFNEQAKKTGVLLHSSDCSIKVVGNSIWHDGKVAVTSNIVIIRSAHRMLGSMYSSISLNIPVKSFRFANNSGIDALFVTFEAVRFEYSGTKYEMIRMGRKQFTDAIGAARRY